MFLLGTQRVNDAGHLEIGGCDTVRLAEQFGTPLYVLDEMDFRERAARAGTKGDDPGQRAGGVQRGVVAREVRR